MHLTFHRSIFWAHLISGIVTGFIILSLAVSGFIIAFEVQLMDWANRDLRVVPPAASPQPLGPGALLAKVKEQKPDLTPSGFTWKGDPTLPAIINAGRGEHHYVNPYTGEYLGEGNYTWHDFFHAVTSWHRFLTGSGLERETGKAVTGAGTLVFGILLVSGIYLWWPRHWRWANLKAALFLNRKLKGRARDWNWHNVFGFWSALPMLFIILTGLIMSYTWANNLLFRATGNEPPPPRTRGPSGPASMAQPGPRGEGAPRGGNSALPLAELEALLDEVRQSTPGWTTLSMRLPSKPGDPFPVMVDKGGRGQVHLRSMLNLDVAQQKVLLSPDDISQQNLGRRLRMYARYLHTGELFGLVGQVIAALCTLSAILLVWTGFALAWRRFFKSKKTRLTEA